MFRSHVKLQVLQRLESDEQSGYDLMRAAKEKGTALSPGYLYPLLQELESSGHIRMRKEGRRNVYAITTKGKRLLALLQRNRETSISTMLRTLGPIADKGEAKDYAAFLARVQRYKQHMMQDMDAWGPFYDGICEAYDKGTPSDRQRIRTIITAATEKLRRRP